MRVEDNALRSGQVQIFERVTGFVFALLAALFVLVVVVVIFRVSRVYTRDRRPVRRRVIRGYNADGWT